MKKTTKKPTVKRKAKAKVKPKTKAKRKRKRKVGRPRVKVDELMLKNLATIGCTQQEMADACGCDKSTLARNFADIIQLAQSDGKTKLRAAQWRKAHKGSDRMLIHLGEHRLGQTATLNHNVDATVTTEDLTDAKKTLERMLARRFAVRESEAVGGESDD